MLSGLWCCMWGRGQEGAMAPTPLSAGFQSFPLLPTIKLGPSGAGSQVGGLLHTLDPCGSLQRPLPWGWEFLLLLLLPRVFSPRGLGLYFPRTGALGCAVCFTPHCMSQFIYVWVWPRGATCHSACPVLRHSESGPLGLSVGECGAAGSASARTACPFPPTLRQSRFRHSNSSPLRPSYRSGWMFILYFLGVGLPCPSIFCQFWLRKEAQCVYPSRHLGCPSDT